MSFSGSRSWVSEGERGRPRALGVGLEPGGSFFTFWWLCRGRHNMDGL